MTANINFIFPAETARKAVFYSGWVLITALAAASAFMVFDGIYMRSHRADLAKKLTEKEKESAALKEPANMPSAREISALQRKAAEINRMKISRSPGLSALLGDIESIAPAGVYFTRFEYTLEDGLIQFQASAPSALSIPVFIRLMESSASFRSVTLERQSLREAGTGTAKVIFAVKAEEAR